MMNSAASEGEPAVDLPEEIRSALLGNAAQLLPITLAWSSRVISSLTIEEAAKELERDLYFADYALNTRRTYRLSSQGGKFHSRYEEDRSQSRYSRDYRSVTETSFDVENFFCASRHARDQRWTVGRTSLASRLTENPDGNSVNGSHFFEEIGYILPNFAIDIQQNAGAQSRVLNILGESAELTGIDEVQLDGRKIVRVQIVSENPIRRHAEKVDLEMAKIELNRTGQSEESKAQIIDHIKSQRELPEKCVNVFYLDPQLNYVMRRSEWQYEGTETMRVIECDDFQPIPGRQLHLPKICTARGKNWNDVHEVTEISVDPLPIERFSLKEIIATPGTSLFEGAGASQKRYVVKDDGTMRELGRGEQG
jgi:hypothetical protein